MKSNYKKLCVVSLMAVLLSACGSSTVKDERSGSVVEQKAERAANRAESNVDRRTDNVVDRAVDNVLKKIF